MKAKVYHGGYTKQGNGEQYQLLIKQIATLITDAKEHVATNLNETLVKTYWNIGKHIVEFEQKGSARAEYGKQLLVNLSKDLTVALGKGFSKSNLFNMRLFYALSDFPDSVWKIELVAHHRDCEH